MGSGECLNPPCDEPKELDEQVRDLMNKYELAMEVNANLERHIVMRDEKIEELKTTIKTLQGLG